MVPEAQFERTESGLAPKSGGWFVINAREGQWRHRPGRGEALTFTGYTDEECESYFPQVGVNLFVLPPGEPIGVYHWEAEVEEFLVVSGEGLLVIEGEERPLRQWDFVHCPPGTKHMILGAGPAGCVVVAIGGRGHLAQDDVWGGYVVDEAAARHGVSPAVDTSHPDQAYAGFPASEPARFREDWLPADSDGRAGET